MAELQIPDFGATIARGRMLYGQQQEQDQQNALAGYLQANGQGLLSGDTNALAGLAQMGPAGLDAAMKIQSGQLDQQNTRLSMRSTRQGMAIDQERLQMAREQSRLAMEDRAAQMTAEQAAAAKAQTDELIAGSTAIQTPQEWDEFWKAHPSAKTNEMIGKFDKRQIYFNQLLGVQDALKAAKGPDGFTLGPNQTRYNPDGSVLASTPDEVKPGWRRASPEEAAAYGAQGGQFGPDGRFDPINPPSGMTISSDGEGGFSLSQGPGVQGKPLNDAQSKNVIYTTRAEGSLPIVDKMGDALTSFSDTAKQYAPGNVGRYFQSPEFQQAKQAGDEFLGAILRKDSGAAITEQEMQVYGTMFLPQPGDLPQVLAQKKTSRARAVEALRRGMTPSEILALEKDGASNPNATVDKGAATRYRYNPETDELEPVK